MDAWRDFCDRLRAAGDRLAGEGFPDDPRGRAEGTRALSRLLVYALQQEMEAGDVDFPSFVRHQDPHNQWGGPNPDNVYLRANVDARGSYRVWCDDARGMRQAIFSLHEGDMQLGEFGVYGETSLDQMEVGEGGRLEIVLSPDERPGNWIPMDPAARIFTVRIYTSDWQRDAVPRFHIVREGFEGALPPPLSPERLETALDRAARWVERSQAFWNQYTSAAWERGTPNVVVPAKSTRGGADHIVYGSCLWELAPDEVLLLDCEAPDADYWGFTLHTLHFLESGDFADRQTSLNDAQTHRDADGRVRVVLAHDDPGVPNWIDTEGRPRGMLVYRFVWARTRPVPEARAVPLASLRESLPADHPVIEPGERRRRLALRREFAWSRYR
ncbi:MAG: DUF1214 domain-containing protein [Myxococcota bacterium]